VSDRGQSLEVMLGDPALAANYAARAGARREALRGFCRDHAITLATLDTTEDPFAVLQRALA
jgi:uncharacterized protein (DUF58 family)